MSDDKFFFFTLFGDMSDYALEAVEYVSSAFCGGECENSSNFIREGTLVTLHLIELKRIFLSSPDCLPVFDITRTGLFGRIGLFHRSCLEDGDTAVVGTADERFVVFEMKGREGIGMECVPSFMVLLFIVKEGVEELAFGDEHRAASEVCLTEIGASDVDIPAVAVEIRSTEAAVSEFRLQGEFIVTYRTEDVRRRNVKWVLQLLDEVAVQRGGGVDLIRLSASSLDDLDVSMHLFDVFFLQLRLEFLIDEVFADDRSELLKDVHLDRCIVCPL